MSKNQLLFRSLTDEWLRALDDWGVPRLTLTNDSTAVDQAALRRFAFVLEFDDNLSTEQERLAGRIGLDREPPSDWKPCGAAVADFVLTRHRCQMLDLADAPSLMQAIEAFRLARLGSTTRSQPPRSGSLH